MIIDDKCAPYLKRLYSVHLKICVT